jgi:hypothetical protein
MRYAIAAELILVLLFLTSNALGANGCGTNWLGGDNIGSETVTPVGQDRPWMKEPEIKPAKVDMSVPEPKITAPKVQKLNNTISNSSTSNNTTSNATGGSIGSKSASTGSSDAVDLAGKWSIELAGASNKALDIQLYSAGTLLWGKGSLSDGKRSIPVAARGSVQGDVLKLDIIQGVDGDTFREDILYKLDLQLGDGAFAGSYEAMGTNGQQGTVIGNGTANGKLASK